MNKTNKGILKLVLAAVVILVLAAAIYFIADSGMIKGSLRPVNYKKGQTLKKATTPPVLNRGPGVGVGGQTDTRALGGEPGTGGF